jgi:uncharacterized protein YoxC
MEHASSNYFVLSITLQFLLIVISRVFHSTQSIVKPQAKSNEAAQKEIEEAMGRVKETQNLISATIDPGKNCNLVFGTRN